jgi:hypothetical protein
MRRTGFIAAAGVIAAVAGGCAGPAPRAANAGRAAEVEFPAAARILDGFSDFRPGEGWSPGDSVLLGIAMEGPGISRRWYLKATALEKPRIRIEEDGGTVALRDGMVITYTRRDGSKGRLNVGFDLVPVEVELFDEHGRGLARTLSMQPEVCMRYGFTDYIRLSREGKQFYDDLPPAAPGEVPEAGETQMRGLAGWLAIMRMPGFMQRKEIDGVLWQLIERPSLLSIALNGGVSLGLSMNPEDATDEPVSPVPAAGPVCRVPLKMDVNGTVAMRCELMVAPPTPPLGPCNGLLGIDAVNPRDPSKRVTIRLLAARHVELPKSEVPEVTEPPAPPSMPPAAPGRGGPAAASPGGSAPSPAGNGR